METVDSASFERLPFIAHVRFTDVKEIAGPYQQAGFYDYGYRVLTMEILELYRGEPLTTAIEIDWTSSCGTAVSAGEEWIVATYLSRYGEPVIEFCTASAPYTDDRGQLILSYGYASRTKDWLDQRCGVLPTSIPSEGPGQFVFNYPNGQVKELTGYLDGSRYGPSRHYYADGTLMDEREYSDCGVPAGLRHHYDADGERLFTLEFRDDGEVIRRTYYQPGYDNFIHEEIIVPKENLVTDFFRRPDGSLARITRRMNWNLLEDKYYDRRERLIHHLMYEEDGTTTLLKDSTALR